MNSTDNVIMWISSLCLLLSISCRSSDGREFSMFILPLAVLFDKNIITISNGKNNYSRVLWWWTRTQTLHHHHHYQHLRHHLLHHHYYPHHPSPTDRSCGSLIFICLIWLSDADCSTCYQFLPRRDDATGEHRHPIQAPAGQPASQPAAATPAPR